MNIIGYTIGRVFTGTIDYNFLSCWKLKNSNLHCIKELRREGKNMNNKEKPKIIKRTKEEIKKYQLAVVKQMLTLATSGFGLVAALAWNELIRTFINDYIRTRISVGSGIISLTIYAIIVTIFAVAITLQLSRLVERLGEKEKK
ncbi:hypothetical protein ES703_22542 [subsurface metagenome]|jgi:type II secretory pathway component PulF